MLHHQGVISIDERKAIRRKNLARLIDEYGQTRLAEMTGIAPAYLYQMGKGRGESKRGISDEKARAIEAALGLSPGWMDINHDQALEVREPTPPQPPEGRWPFRIPYARIARLHPNQKEKIEEVLESMVLRYEASNRLSRRKSSAKQGRVAG